MKFLELINKCLVELNYREVAGWNGLSLNDHKRLKDIISRLNSQICASENWPFLEREMGFRLHAGENRVSNPVNGSITCLLVDGMQFAYSSDTKAFLVGNPPSGKFTAYGGFLYLPRFERNVECKILYNTDDSAQDEDLNEKKYMENETDESLVPEVFQEPLLVYGACMRLKSNPEHNKFKYWYSMYNDSLATMRAKTASAASAISAIRISRD